MSDYKNNPWMRWAAAVQDAATEAAEEFEKVAREARDGVGDDVSSFFHGRGPSEGGRGRGGCGPGGCGPTGHGSGGDEGTGQRHRSRRHHHHVRAQERFGAGMGVRRPLRLMARKLDLDEDQVAKLAGILDDIRTERAQASVDERRSVGAMADLLDAAVFDEGKAEAAAKQRAESAMKLAEAVATCMRRTHELLDEEQRSKLAYLLRSGVLTI